MRLWLSALLTLTAILTPAVKNTASAGSLQVSPVSIEVPAPGAAAKMHVRNLGETPITAQIRVFRWVQKNGADHLIETRDAIAAPPLVQITPKSEQLVRIVRVSKAPTDGEESYRLLVDEVPAADAQKGIAVNFAIRYSVPVFFSASADRSATLAWSVTQRDGKIIVSARNPGNRRIRIAALKVSAPGGRSISFGDGLVGYVLGRSEAIWQAKGVLGNAVAGGKVEITAQTENGLLQATGTMQAPR